MTECITFFYNVFKFKKYCKEFNDLIFKRDNTLLLLHIQLNNTIMYRNDEQSGSKSTNLYSVDNVHFLSCAYL